MKWWWATYVNDVRWVCTVGYKFRHTIPHATPTSMSMTMPRALYPTKKHLPTYRREIDVFFDLKR